MSLRGFFPKQSVYYEILRDVKNAISQEKQIKGGSRAKKIDEINRKEIIVRIKDSINDWKDVVLAKYSDTMSPKNKLDKDSLIMNITFFHQLCRGRGEFDRKCLEDLKKNIHNTLVF
ncbi:hypothetical protein [Candidatus Kuenenia sp.]|uniref:hypothetical protein n=1 Tax=Candidatus Kuenenia sp. TaxID=2499824 RepID=UPI003AF5737B